MLNNSQFNQIQDLLFTDPEQYVYAVIDGAACPELRFKIYDWEPVSSCLWSGELEPDLEEVAPYMVLLERDSQFTEWLITESWGQNWNIFVQSPLEPKAFRKQIRKLLLVRSPNGKNLAFRFYDPRVLSIIAPLLDFNQIEEIFKDISYLTLQTTDNKNLLTLQCDNETHALRFIKNELTL
jgi:hypothetical protein